ncbi:MAG: matrixin family metalloprotease, partial [Acidobacteriota bacterium]|nr:matrixin family metalloprotease [Acidobacteriota bacterium]
MQLQLGPTNVILEDGSGTWDVAAADALNLWNQQMSTFQFAWTVGSAAAEAYNDGVNSVFFSNAIYGEAFGQYTLAVTVVLFDRTTPSVSIESDVIFNNAFSYNSYRGPLHRNGASTVYDFHRIALHEFGHVLGLNHPDEAGQTQPAIMDAVISDLDSLQADDIAGARYLYG